MSWRHSVRGADAREDAAEARRGSDPQSLATAFEDHLTETKQHVANVEAAFEAIGEKPKAEKCPGIEGLKTEHDEFVKDEDPSSDVLDMFLTGAGARTEHYEIAAYTGLVTMADALGEKDAAKLLRANLEQETAALDKLTTISRRSAVRCRPPPNPVVLWGGSRRLVPEHRPFCGRTGRVSQPMPPDRCIVLDVDGTLVDSNYLHVVAWQAAFADHGHRVASWEIHRAVGMGSDKLVPALLGDAAAEEIGEAVSAEHDARFRRVIADVEPLPGARDLLSALKRRGLTVVLGSSAAAEEVDTPASAGRDGAGRPRDDRRGRRSHEARPRPDPNGHRPGRRSGCRHDRGHGVGLPGGGRGRPADAWAAERRDLGSRAAKRRRAQRPPGSVAARATARRQR